MIKIRVCKIKGIDGSFPCRVSNKVIILRVKDNLLEKIEKATISQKIINNKYPIRG